MTFCIPKQLNDLFRDALRPDPKNPSAKGPLHPENLRKMTSSARRELFKNIGKGLVDDDFARELNLKYEKQLLLKDQQKAMVNFINDLQGLNPKVKKDLVDQVLGLEQAISPNNARNFLEDFVATKLGASVSHDEAEEIFTMAQKAEVTKKAWEADPTNDEARINFAVDMVKLNDRVNELKGNNETNWDKAFNIANLPKAMEATWDYSASLVQAGSMITDRHFWSSMVQQFKYGWSEEEFTRMRANILSHPYYELAKKSKLAIKNIGDRLSPNEEYMGSNLIDKANQWLKTKSTGLLPGLSKDASGSLKVGMTGYVPNVTRGADRAFMGFLNNLRFQTFVDAVDAAKLRGEDVSVGSKAVRDIAENINTFTGHGNIGPHDAFGNAVPFLNLFAWTIRKVSSTLTLMSPVPFVKASPTARAFAMRQMFGYLTATASLYGLARMAGYEVPLDPSDSHFGWVKIGDTWHNPLGDKPVYFRLLWRLATGRIVNGAGVESRFARSVPEMLTGEHPKIDNRFDNRSTLLLRFARSKLGPNASMFSDAVTEKDYMGNDVGLDWDTAKREAAQRLPPMSLSSMLDVMQNSHDNTVGQILSMFSVFGSSVYVDTPQSRQGLTAWGEGLADRVDNSKLDHALLEINQNMKFPPKKLNGVTLSDNQYHDYITIFGQAAKEQLSAAIESGEWDGMSTEEKEQAWKNALRLARKSASDAVMQNSVDNQDGEENPVFDLMHDNTDQPDSKPNVMRLEKRQDSRVKQVLKAPVASEAEMKQQWHKFILQDYDYGKLIETNPLAYLGYQALKKMPGGLSNNIRETTLETSNMGSTYPESGPVTRESYDSDYSWKVELESLKQAGLDPNSAIGKIVMGPQFFRDGIYSLEHELMHKGLQELVKRTEKDSPDNIQARFGQRNDEPLMRAFQMIKGTHGQEYPKDLGWDPKYYLEKNYPQVAKKPKEYSAILESIQDIARNYINKGK